MLFVCVFIQLEEFLSKMENADYWRTITDRSSGKGVVLTDNQIDIIQKLQHSNFPEEGAEPYAVSGSSWRCGWKEVDRLLLV